MPRWNRCFFETSFRHPALPQKSGATSKYNSVIKDSSWPSMKILEEQKGPCGSTNDVPWDNTGAPGQHWQWEFYQHCKPQQHPAHGRSEGCFRPCLCKDTAPQSLYFLPPSPAKAVSLSSGTYPGNAGQHGCIPRWKSTKGLFPGTKWLEQQTTGEVKHT